MHSLTSIHNIRVLYEFSGLTYVINSSNLIGICWALRHRGFSIEIS